MMGVPNTTPLTPEQSELAAKNYKLAWDAFLNHRPRGVDDSDETLSAAFEGLVRAARKYDPEKGFCFSTYAMGWMKQTMRRSSQRRLVHIPAYHFDDRGIQPSERYRADAERAKAVLSIHHDRDEGRLRLDIPAPNPIDHEERDRQIVRLLQAIECLPPRERIVIELEMAGKSCPQITARLGISRRTLENRLASAIRQLREDMIEDEAESSGGPRKRCWECRKRRPLDEFHFRESRQRHRSYCHDCERLRDARRMRDPAWHIEWQREYRRRRREMGIRPAGRSTARSRLVDCLGKARKRLHGMTNPAAMAKTEALIANLEHEIARIDRKEDQ